MRSLPHHQLPQAPQHTQDTNSLGASLLYNEPKGWFYRIRFLKCDYNPSLVGLEDEEFITETLLVADNTVLETVE